ncbi:MAG: hypothetical protein DSZ28_07305 [Thiothrix sp.]|nr:MAG: hypothetical protein DSZ28_07305 [Thiothrix sp.]
MIRLFLDANILFTAAHNPKGKAALVIELGQQGRWKIVTSNYAYSEAERNLRLKFPDRLADLESLMTSIGILPTGTGANCPIELRQKDRPIFESALQAQATHLLTGDLRDFGVHMNKADLTENVVIQTVADFLLAQV